METAQTTQSPALPVLGFTDVALKHLVESRTNPRTHLDKDADQELIDSVRQRGVLVPLLVRRVKDAALEIVAGHRRYRAAKAAKVDTIPVRILELTDEQAIEIQIVENLQRQDVHPLDEGEGYKRLMQQDAKKWTAETIAGKVGKSVRYVYARIALTTLIGDAKKALQQQTIAAGHADLLCRLQPADQGRALEFCLFNTDFGKRRRDAAPSVRALQKWIQENIHLELAKAPFDIRDAKLVPKAGACTTCPKQTANNPNLFPDIPEKKATCTDPACYQEKKLALVKISLANVEEKTGVKPQPISEDYKGHSGAQKGVLYTESYSTEGTHGPIKKDSCPDTVLGVYVDGDRVGKTAWICTKGYSCKTHHPRFDVSSQMGGAQLSKARKAHSLYKKYSRALFKSVADAVKKPKRADLELALLSFYRHLGHYQVAPMLECLGWDPDSSFYTSPGLRRRVAKFTDAQLLSHFVLFAATSDLVSPTLHEAPRATPKVLLGLAHRHGVKARRILADLKAKADRKKKNKPVKQAPVKTSAKPKAKAKKKARAKRKR